MEWPKNLKKTIAILLILVQILFVSFTTPTVVQALQGGEISTIAGGPGYGQATELGQAPLGVASSDSYIYVADRTYDVIRRIDKLRVSKP